MASIAIAPPSKRDTLPDPLVEGGESVTLTEAGEIYGRCVGGRYTSGEPSKVGEHVRRYGQFHRADRAYQERYDVTTCLLTLRVSPRLGGDRLPPLTCDELLHESRESVMKSLRYQLREYEFEWVAVTAGTDRATAHTHLYLWVDDPEHSITSELFEPVIDTHVETCPLASADSHGDEAVSIEHEPSLTERDPCRGAVTQGIKYVATQLAHLPLSREGSLSLAELKTGALAWASEYQWVRTSGGI